MHTVRIAVASTPLTATLEEAVPAAIAAIESAARERAAIVCLPETGLPGHRGQARRVPAVSRAELDAAVASVADAVRRAAMVAIVGLEYPTAAGLEIRSIVINANGEVIGHQAKTQIDPSEEPRYIFGSGRRIFTAAGLTFGVAICHEAFRYPEISRALALAGAQVIFVPQYVTTDDGERPREYLAVKNPYNEKALMCRALENTVFVAASNNAGPDQGAATCIVAPDGSLVGQVPYGAVGVIAADVDLELATARIARRWAPERNTMQR